MSSDTKLPAIALVASEVFGGVDGGQRRRDPARLQGVRGIGAGPARLDAVLLARLQDRVADLVEVLVRTPQLEAGSAGHAVAQAADLQAQALDREVAHVEELHL